MKEYKIIEIPRKYIKKDYSYAEAVMNTEAADGWDVVSVTVDTGKDISGILVITFSREKGSGKL